MAEPETLNSRLTCLVRPLLDWFAVNARDLPWRSRQVRRNPYAIWISEVMLQQTQVKTVVPYWRRWMCELPDVQALARAKPQRILKLWEGLGYYTRARNLQRAAQRIVGKHQGRFPRTFDEILALPGIGRYTAGAICSIAFNQPTPVLDGNVIRVLARVHGISANPRERRTNEQLWKLAEDLVSHAKTQSSQRKSSACLAPLRENDSCSFLNQSLMELGAVICTPRQPNCPECPVRKLCVAFRENRVLELPNLGKRAASTSRRFIAFVAERGAKFLVHQRPAGGVNAQLWEFPNVEVGARFSEPQRSRSPTIARPKAETISTETRRGAKDPRAEAARGLGLRLSAAKPLCTLKHSITRYRITLEAYRATPDGVPVPRNRSNKWLPLARLRTLAFAGAHRKILTHLQVAAKLHQ